MHLPRFLAILLLLAVAAPARAEGPDAASAVAFNRLVLSIAEEEDRFLTLKGVRTAAMLHVAMHDVLNALDPRYRTWTEPGPTEAVDAQTAAVHAAFAVAADQYPDQEVRLAAERDRWAVDDPGAVRVGQAVARAVLARRAEDGWDGEAEYQWHPMGPGVYAEFSEHSGTPEGFVFGAGWAAARPFLLPSADHFRSPPPPAIDSEAYTEAFKEVKSVGATASATRTPDQTHLAMWWKDFVENSHNRLARDLAGELDLWEASRLFALLNLAIYDAYVNVFDNKFHHNHWRPFTAIRWAAHDGNPSTGEDPDWDNLHRHTYAFPSYPSAHGCASAAAMTVLADTFGSDRAFTMRTPRVDRAGPMSEKVDMDPPTRSFGSFAEAALECSMSRVYLGIHFRYDSVEGNRLGTRIGRYAVENFLTPMGR